MSHFTTNTTPVAAREASITLLQPLLAEALDLFGRFKQVHWTVRGPQFLMLHELFDKAASEMTGNADTLAERIVALGGHPNGLVQDVVKASKLPHTPASASSLLTVIVPLSAFLDAVRNGIDASTTHGDPVTADLLTGMAGEGDKLLWFLEAHIDPGELSSAVKGSSGGSSKAA